MSASLPLCVESFPLMESDGPERMRKLLKCFATCWGSLTGRVAERVAVIGVEVGWHSTPALIPKVMRHEAPLVWVIASFLKLCFEQENQKTLCSYLGDLNRQETQNMRERKKEHTQEETQISLEPIPMTPRPLSKEEACLSCAVFFLVFALALGDITVIISSARRTRGFSRKRSHTEVPDRDVSAKVWEK